MHHWEGMTVRSHLWLRIGALALVAAAAIWPRSKPSLTAAEIGRTGGRARVEARFAAIPETTAARLLSPPANAKVVMAQADESELSN